MNEEHPIVQVAMAQLREEEGEIVVDRSARAQIHAALSHAAQRGTGLEAVRELVRFACFIKCSWGAPLAAAALIDITKVAARRNGVVQLSMEAQALKVERHTEQYRDLVGVRREEVCVQTLEDKPPTGSVKVGSLGYQMPRPRPR